MSHVSPLAQEATNRLLLVVVPVLAVLVVSVLRRRATTAQRQYRQALEEQRQSAALLERVAEGLVVVNGSGQVVMMNPAAKQLLAVTQPEPVGSPLQDLLRQEHQLFLVEDGHHGADRPIVVSAKPETAQRVLRASQGRVTDEQGRLIGLIARLNDAPAPQEPNPFPPEFVSKIRHDLRTPLVALQQALLILRDEVAGPLSLEQQEFVSLSLRNLQQLQALIDSTWPVQHPPSS